MPQHGEPFTKGHVALLKVMSFTTSVPVSWTNGPTDFETWGQSPHPIPAPWSLEAWAKEKMVLRLFPRPDLDQFRERLIWGWWAQLTPSGTIWHFLDLSPSPWIMGRRL